VLAGAVLLYEFDAGVLELLVDVPVLELLLYVELDL
jgi:hypothetical protein